MSPLTKKQTVIPGLPDETSVKPLEKEKLKSIGLDKELLFINDRCVIRVANRFELRKSAYEFVYKIYLDEGYIKKENSKLRLSIYHAHPDTTTLLAEKHNGNLCGTFTTVFDSPLGLPSDLQYKKEIDRLRNDGRKICELISFGINREQRGSVKILAGLFYCCYLLIWSIKESTDCIINVIPSQADFYCTNLLFRKIGNEKSCPRTRGIPAVLLHLQLSSLSNMREKKRVFPFSMFHYSYQEEMKIARKLKRMLSPISDEDFYTFFIEKTDIWEKASDEQKDYIKKLYPIDQADHFRISRAMARAVSKKLSASK